MYENIKLIAADIDGTIVRTDRVITETTIKAIEDLRKNGYLFGLATGRPVEDIIYKYKEWNISKQFDFIIGWNGCELYDDKTKITHKYNYLSKDEIKEIVEFMSKYKNTINMYKPNSIYLSSEETDRSWYSAFKNKRTYTVAKSLEEFYNEDNGGIMFRTSEKLMPEIEEAVSKLKGKNYIGFKTQPDLMEFCHKDCTKGYALKKYAQMYNLDIMDCMGFGDTSNDNEMLRVCLGVCMKNGSDDTKACAKVITDKHCDEDGFADFIYKNLL